MATENTETHEIARRGGTLTVKITYTPGVRKHLRLYSLKMEVTSVTEGLSPYVFVYQRATKGAPAGDGSPRDEFFCVADELDEDEFPTEEQGPDPAHGMPYYRAKSVELLFRNSDLMYETVRSIIDTLSRPS